MTNLLGKYFAVVAGWCQMMCFGNTSAHSQANATIVKNRTKLTGDAASSSKKQCTE